MFQRQRPATTEIVAGAVIYALGVILSVAGAYLEWHLPGALLAAGIGVAVFVVNL